MEKIKALIEQMKKNNLATLNKDSKKEEIEAVNTANANLDKVLEEAQAIDGRRQEVTEMYVNAVKSSGSTKEDEDKGESDKPKSLEECIEEVVKDSK